MKCSLHILLFLLFFISCNKPDAPKGVEVPPLVDTTVTLVMQVSQCARLYTAECVVRKVVTHSDAPRLQGNVMGIDVDMPLRMGERKVAIPIDVTLKAYVDFSRFSARQIHRTDSSITLVLPDPVIVATASKVDHHGTRQFVDLTRTRYTDAEMAEYARQGADSIISHASQYGLAEQARSSAARLLIPIVRRMGYRDDQVTVRFRKEFNDRELREFTTIIKP